MKAPLDSFAARIVRCGELNEFLEGLCDVHGVKPETIIRIGNLLQERARINEQVEQNERVQARIQGRMI